MTVLITLTTAGTDSGPFSLYSNLDGFVTPFETGISKSALVSGYTSTLVPDFTATVRVKSTGTCTNYVDLTVSGGTTTTTSSTSTTTTTTSSTSTTTTTTSSTSTTTTTSAPIASIFRVGSCVPNQISTDYTVYAPPGSTVILRADFGGSFVASSAGSSASVTIGGFNNQSTSCYYSGTQYFSLAPTYTFTMGSGGSQIVSTSANTYEADETNTSLTVVIVSVDGIANGAYVSGCRGDSTGGPC
jgi:hypothetical protein